MRLCSTSVLYILLLRQLRQIERRQDTVNQLIQVAEKDGKIVSSCVCVIIPNLTHGQQPYAFIENVITDENYRKRGLATACLDYAREIAEKEHCYKMMLLTGSKKESTLNFYRQAGYNSEDKTASRPFPPQ
mgnify:CR=1 FL=1